MTDRLTPQREAELEAGLNDLAALVSHWHNHAQKAEAELAAVRKERDEAREELAEQKRATEYFAAQSKRRKTERDEALRVAAEEIVASCPDHGSREEAWMDCHCAVADELRLHPDQFRGGAR